MTRLSTSPRHGKKHVPNIVQRQRQHMDTEDGWRRKPSMPAYCRPKHPKWDIDSDADDAEMVASHDA